VVEDIREIGAKLQIKSLCQAEIPAKSVIELDEPKSAQRVAGKVPLSQHVARGTNDSRIAKCARIEASSSRAPDWPKNSNAIRSLDIQQPGNQVGAWNSISSYIG
jgi:hypothetical protein